MTHLFRLTPLHLASMSKTGCECIKLLLHYDPALVDVQDRFRRTPIMYSIKHQLDSNVIGK
jgi:ankyrin repeat protein